PFSQKRERMKTFGFGRGSGLGETGGLQAVRPPDLLLGRLRRPEGEHDLEGGSLPEFALDVDRAAVRLHHLARDPEAEAEAAVVAGGDGALEAPEDSSLILGGDPDAVVANDDARVV